EDGSIDVAMFGADELMRAAHKRQVLLTTWYILVPSSPDSMWKSPPRFKCSAVGDTNPRSIWEVVGTAGNNDTAGLQLDCAFVDLVPLARLIAYRLAVSHF